MSYFPVDLKPYFNHKLFYTEVPKSKKEEFGLDNICILRNDIKLKEQDTLENVKFCFCFGQYDNVVCDRQKIMLNAFATRVHLISFAYWGDTNEFFKIVYEDLSEENLRVPFIDWSHEPYKDFIGINWYGKNTSTARIVTTSGADKHPAYFHHTVCEIRQRKIIKEIILPDNMLTHIFAMTLENENTL